VLLCRISGRNRDEEEVAIVFDLMDCDGDGAVSLSDFERFVSA
jgi:Ca2+-binding EF-hand superfamily protein